MSDRLAALAALREQLLDPDALLDRILKNNPRAPFICCSIPEWAANTGLSWATAKRLISRGQGPVVTKLSGRRRGIQLRHELAWALAREVAAPPTARDVQDNDQS